MTKREAIKHVKSYDIFPKFTLDRLSRGTNSDAFLIISGGKKYVLRSRRQDSRHQNLLKNHFVNLKFLQAAKVDFTPRAIHYDPKEQLLLASYLPGRAMVESKLRGKELKRFAEYLVKINNLSHKLYKKICAQYKFKALLPESPSESIRKYGITKFNYIKRYCLEEEIVHWIKPRLTGNIKYLDSLKWESRQMGFSHGDLTGANILVYRNKLYIIDWERSRFTYSRDFRLGYTMMHFEFFLNNQDKLIKFVAKAAKQNEDNLRENANKSMQGVKINDVIWAAQVYSELKRKNERGWKKYRTITYRRMLEYEEMFEK